MLSLLAVIGALYAIMIFFGIYGYGKIIENKDKETALCYAVIMGCCFVGMTAAIWSTHLMSRFAIKCVISEDGIYFKRLLKRGIMLKWDSVVRYGVIGNSVLYESMTALYFSTNIHERTPKNIKEAYVINNDRIILECRQALLSKLFDVMPDDMTKRLKNMEFSGQNTNFRR